MRPFSDTCPLRQRAGKSPALRWRIWSLDVPYCNFNSKYSKQAELVNSCLFLSWPNDKFLLLLPARTRLTFKVPNSHTIRQMVPVKLRCDAVDFMVIRRLNVVTRVSVFGSVHVRAILSLSTWYRPSLNLASSSASELSAPLLKAAAGVELPCRRHRRVMTWKAICGPIEASQKHSADVTCFPPNLTLVYDTSNRFLRPEAGGNNTTDSNSWTGNKKAEEGESISHCLPLSSASTLLCP